MTEILTPLAVVAVFFLAGAIKGVIGLGLPTVSLGLLTVIADLQTAMALLLVPSFVTNIWQALSGGRFRVILARTWPFLLMATSTVWIGTAILTRVESSLASATLGLLLVAYATTSLAGIRFAIAHRNEKWLGPLFGTVNGFLTGLTGSFVVPGVMFLHAIGLPRDLLIQAMGMLFAASTVALALALGSNELLTVKHGTISAGAVIPALAGMILGQRLRTRLSETHFRKVFFIGILCIGSYIVLAAMN